MENQEVKNNFIKRFSSLLEEKGFTYEEIAKKIGVSKTSIFYYKNGKSFPDSSKIVLLAELFDVDPAYLAGFDVPKKIKNKVNINIHKTIDIPLYGTVEAGFNHIPDLFDGEYIAVPEEFVSMYNIDHLFALKIKGDSMYPNMLPGDVVLVHSQLDVLNGQIGIFEYDENTTIKQLFKDEKNKIITLKPFNPEHPTTTFTFNEARDVRLRCIGRVIQLVYRKF